MIGQTIGHYEVLAALGAGGMGEVYLAHDSQLQRKVALKILPEKLASSPERLERFKREARSLAAVSHPNIVAVYSVEEADGIHFLTMELVEGETLAELLPQGGMPLDRIFEIAGPLSEALAEAHEAGIVHRDLKPSNLMLTESRRLKMLDFGLAKAIEGDLDENASQLATEALTAEGTVMGTVPYMSPEQIEGKTVDARSDIFSLGVILHEMATGERPFQGETSPSLMSSILKDTPPDVSQLRADLPRHLGRIIRHCLEKKPGDRTQTARDVHNQIRSLKLETTTDQEAIVPPTEVLEPARKSPRAWIGIAAALLLALGGFGIWRALAPRTAGQQETPAAAAVQGERKPLVIVLPFDNLGEADDQYFADGMTEEVISRLAVLEDLSVISRTTAMQYKDRDLSIERLGEELGVDYVLEGSVRWQKSDDGPSRVRVTPQLIRVSDDTPMWAERYDAVLADIFEVQSDVAEQVSSQLGIALGEPQRQVIAARATENLEAYDAFLKGNEYLFRGREVQDYDDILLAIQMYDRAIELDDTFVLAYVRASVAHSWLYGDRHDRSEDRLSLARRAADRALELAPDSPDAHFANGFFEHWSQGDQELALSELRLALAGKPGSAEIHEAISFVETSVGNWEAALASLQRATELNPRSGRLPCWAGGQCFGLRRYDEAKHYHDRAIELRPDRACPYACQTWIAMNRQGGTEYARDFLERLPDTLDLEGTPPLAYPWVVVDMMDNRYDDALRRLESGEKAAYEFRVFYVPKTLLAAQIHQLQGNVEKASSLYRESILHLEEKRDQTPADPRIRSSLGIAYAGVGREEAAVREAEYALVLIGDDRSESLGYRLRDLAQVYTMTGSTEAALDTIETLVSIPAFFSTWYVAEDPAFDTLHDEIRFQEILEEHAPVDDRRPAHT